MQMRSSQSSTPPTATHHLFVGYITLNKEVHSELQGDALIADIRSAMADLTRISMAEHPYATRLFVMPEYTFTKYRDLDFIEYRKLIQQCAHLAQEFHAYLIPGSVMKEKPYPAQQASSEFMKMQARYEAAPQNDKLVESAMQMQYSYDDFLERCETQTQPTPLWWGYTNRTWVISPSGELLNKYSKRYPFNEVAATQRYQSDEDVCAFYRLGQSQPSSPIEFTAQETSDALTVQCQPLICYEQLALMRDKKPAIDADIFVLLSDSTRLLWDVLKTKSYGFYIHCDTRYNPVLIINDQHPLSQTIAVSCGHAVIGHSVDIIPDVAILTTSFMHQLFQAIHDNDIDAFQRDWQSLSPAMKATLIKNLQYIPGSHISHLATLVLGAENPAFFTTIQNDFMSAYAETNAKIAAVASLLELNAERTMSWLNQAPFESHIMTAIMESTVGALTKIHQIKVFLDQGLIEPLNAEGKLAVEYMLEQASSDEKQVWYEFIGMYYLMASKMAYTRIDYWMQHHREGLMEYLSLNMKELYLALKSFADPTTVNPVSSCRVTYAELFKCFFKLDLGLFRALFLESSVGEDSTQHATEYKATYYRCFLEHLAQSDLDIYPFAEAAILAKDVRSLKQLASAGFQMNDVFERYVVFLDRKTSAAQWHEAHQLFADAGISIPDQETRRCGMSRSF